MSLATIAVWAGLLLQQPVAASAAAQPSDIEGLVAWYTLAEAHAKLRDTDTLGNWKDVSGHGHDLIDDKNGVSAVFRTKQVGGKPAVVIARNNTHTVSAPFVLADHTIFLVYRGGSSRAFFRSDLDETVGLLLRDGEQLEHRYQNGRPDLGAAYNAPMPSAEEGFTITVLGRSSGVLKSFVNGAERSSNATFTEPMRVGKLFHLKKTQFAESDGWGLQIAEMIFYDRYLDDDERQSVSRYLAQKFELPLADPPQVEPPPPAPPPKPPLPDRRDAQAWLTSSSRTNLNEPAVRIAWEASGAVAAPFRYDAKTPTKLHCMRDGTRAALQVVLPITTEAADAELRILVLKNGAIYEKDEARVSPPGVAELATSVSLNAGDFIEIIASGIGAPGQVMLAGKPALLVVKAE